MHKFIIKVPNRPCLEAYHNALQMALKVGCPKFIKIERARITDLLKMTKTSTLRNGLLAARVGLKHAHLMMLGKINRGEIMVYCGKKAAKG